MAEPDDRARGASGSRDPGSQGEPDPPKYKVYRSGPRLFRRDRDGGRADAFEELRGDARPGDRPEYNVHRAGRPQRPGTPVKARRRLSVGRLLRWVVLGVLAWCLVSLVLFLISAQLQRQEVSEEARAALDPSGFTLTSPNTILVLGSDARTEENAEPGSQVGGRSRSDSIMLMRIGGGHNATMSIPRDAVVDIPGYGRNKINAAYAIGGPALALATVKQYLGIEVNHLVEVNFENFPALIDAMGGVEVRTGCVVSRINGGYRNGGYTLRLRRGVNELDGDQALALARTRKNECAPDEDDRTRARRQQLILAGLKDKIVSLETFARLPWVAWQGPKAIRTDMSGPELLGLVGATLFGGDPNTAVLKPSANVTLPDGGSALEISEEERQRRVERFLER